MMTAAMAFFSIALTLNLTGVQLSDLKLANLRPSAVRSFMERRLTMASTPIIRYYDHLRLVYEVETRMRELRRTTQGEGNDNQQPNDAQPAAPGESKQNLDRKDGGSRVDPPQQSGTPALKDSSDYVEASLTLQDRQAQSGQGKHVRAEFAWAAGGSDVTEGPQAGARVSSGNADSVQNGSATGSWERSTVWTA